MTSSGGEKRRELFAKDEIERSLIARLAHVVEIHAERVVLRDGQVICDATDFARAIGALHQQSGEGDRSTLSPHVFSQDVISRRKTERPPSIGALHQREGEQP